jgi:hypothetical protein
VSPLFSGLSYLLHVTKSEGFDAPAVLGLIQSSLPEALPVPGTRGDHATYRLPLGRSSEVANMMMELTERAEQVGVRGGALESTTLEEIFMQFAGEAAVMGICHCGSVINFLLSRFWVVTSQP